MRPKLGGTTLEIDLKKLYKEHGIKVLFYDIEKAPALGWCWGPYDPPFAMESISTVSCIAYKWGHEDKVHAIAHSRISHFDDFRKDKAMLKSISEKFNEADFIVAHNGDKFDWKHLQAAILRNGLPPVKKPRMIDTLKMVKSEMKFDSHRLGDLCKVLNIPLKIETEKNLFISSITSWQKYLKLVEYNIGDVVALEALFYKLVPHCKPFINMARLKGLEVGCASCGSTNLVKDGHYVTLAGNRVQRHKCKDCGSKRTRDSLIGDKTGVAL